MDRPIQAALLYLEPDVLVFLNSTSCSACGSSVPHEVFLHCHTLVTGVGPTATPTAKEAAKNGRALSAHLTMFANYYGLPAVSLPCGLDSRGLPVGLQIVAKPLNDAAVLQLAYEYERRMMLVNDIRSRSRHRRQRCPWIGCHAVRVAVADRSGLKGSNDRKAPHTASVSSHPPWWQIRRRILGRPCA
jgi:hypothetical protein